MPAVNTPFILPRSPAKNAYELFDDLITRIEANPDMLDMSDWYKPTACGTTACLGGWFVTLRHVTIGGIEGEFFAFSDAAYYVITGDRIDISWDLPDLPDYGHDLMQLFFCDHKGTSYKDVLARMRIYQTKWATRLKARTYENT